MSVSLSDLAAMIAGGGDEKAETFDEAMRMTYDDSSGGDGVDNDNDIEAPSPLPSLSSSPLSLLHQHNEDNDDDFFDTSDGTIDRVDYGGLDDPTAVQIEDEDGVLAFYEDISSRKLPPIRHLSMSEGSFGNSSHDGSHSSERSSLLLKRPLQGLNRHTPIQLWLYRAWKVYGKALDRRPVLTKSITACIIVGLGDVAGQYLEGPEDGATKVVFDAIRLCRFASMGMIVQAPITHYYYEALDKYFPPTETPWTRTTFLKLLIDQTIYAPTFLWMVFVYLGLLEGSSWHEIDEQLDRDYFTTLCANWKLWIPATLINLAYCAPRYRVLYCNLVFFVWSIFLSLVLSPAGIKNG